MTKFGGGPKVKDECRGSVMTRPLCPRLGWYWGWKTVRGALVVKAVVSAMKMVIVGKGRNESGIGAGGMVTKKRCFNQ